MNCDELHILLHGYQDGELDLVRSLEVEAHLGGCSACAELSRQNQELRQALRAPALYQRARPQLRERILSSLPRERATLPPLPARARRFRFLAVGLGSAAVVLLAILTWGIVHLRSLDEEEFLVREVVSGHVRSQLSNRLLDVEASDAHTVKPWYQGKLDYSPPVRDLGDEGYPLQGGRLEYLDNRKAAALVYKRRQHVINLFVWPASASGGQPSHTLTRQGYHLIHFTHDGFSYWAISDLNEDELHKFVDLIQR